ncbi:unnamed protein product [Effrenium voratum]|nr:unnamed protein product [Effrenium voratum]
MGPICTETTGGLPSSPAKNSWAPQKAGAKLSFEGVSTAWQKVKDGDEMTWEVMWQSKGSPNMDHSFIMGSNACGSMEAGIGITVRSTGELGGCSIVGGTWDNYVGLAPNVDMKVLDGKWHHIVVVFSRSQKTLKLYLDGAVAYDKTVIKTTNTDGDLGSDFAFGPGRRTYNGKAYEHDSRFARIALWSRALSGDEIKNCKDKCPTSDGLVALYTMDNTYDDAQGKYAALTNHDGAFSSDIYTTTDMCLWAGSSSSTGGLPSSPAKNSWAPQKAGAKLSFEGVSTAWQKVKDGDEMTWEVMWQSKGSPNMDHSFIMGSNACGSMEAGIGITVRSTGELGGCSIVGGTGANYVGLAPNVDMKVLDGKWHHIVVVFSRSQKTLKLYLDGAVAYDKTVIKTTNTDGDLGSDFAFGPGRRTYNGKAYEHDSRFARIALWSRALSGDEIKNCKDECPTSDGLVALYTMDNTYDDAQGKYAALTNHDGAFSSDIYTTTDMCLWAGSSSSTGGLPSSPAKNSWAPQKAGAKLSFEGVSTAWQKVKDGDEMTWEVMWQSKGSPNMDHSFIMGSNACGSMEAGIGITVRSTGELGGCSIVGGTGANYVGLAPNVDMKVLDGKWHHIVVVFSRSQKTLKLYLDGAVAYDKTVIKTTNTDGDLGSDFAFGPGRRTYNGKAYEHDSRFARIALWSRALSGDEIKNCKDKCPTSDGLVALYTMDNTYDDAQGKYAALTNHDGAFSSDIYTTTDMCLWK